MVRRLLLVFLLVACANPPAPNAAVTITGPPTASATTAIEDHTQERITAAKADIDAERFGAASHALLAIVCGNRAVRGADDLARCPATPFVNTAEAWGLIGELALKNRLEVAQTEWGAARRVVTRWEGRANGAQLEVADIALAHATRLSASAKYAFELATTRDKLRHYGPALEAYAKVLESGTRSHRSEALEGATHCITYFDWDGDGTKDAVTGFDRPEVRNVLASSSQPWVAEVYVRALDSLVDTDDCAAARSGASELARRFPQNPNVSRITAAVQNCP
jgi:hypothetical protein